MDLSIYKEYEPIYVIGHSNIDIDSAVSSKILSEIFNSFGVESYYAVLEEKYNPDPFNKKMMDECMDFNPIVVKKADIKNYNWFLIDHNDRVQSVGWDANVIGSIDHHPYAENVPNFIYTDICSVSLFLYNKFKDNYEFNDSQKYQIFLAFLNDSTFGKASRFKESDGVIADQLGFGRNYDELFKKFFIPTDLSNGLNSQLKNGSKKYDFEDVHFESGYIETYGIDKLNEYKELINAQNAFLGLWIDYNTDKTYAYFKYDGILTEFKYDYVASRATTILTDVLSYLKNNNYLK